MEWVEIISKILNFISEVLIPLIAEFFGGIQDWDVITW